MGEIKPSTAPDLGFADIAQLIAAAKQRALQAVIASVQVPVRAK